MWTPAQSMTPHMSGWRVTRMIPRAGSAALSAPLWPTAVGLRVVRLAASRISAKGITASGKSRRPGTCHTGWTGALE